MMLGKLVWNNIRKNKKRNLFTILGIIIIATAIFTSLELLSSYQHYKIETVREKNNWEIKISNIFSKEVSEIKKENLKSINTTCNLGDMEIESRGIMDYVFRLYACDKQAMEKLNFPVKTGRLPQNENEIAIAEESFDYIEIRDKEYKDKRYTVGDTFTFENNNIQKQYTIVGILKSTPYDISSDIRNVHGAITYLDEKTKQQMPLDIYLTLQNPYKTYKVANEIQESQIASNTQIEYNEELLEYLLISQKDQGFKQILLLTGVILLIIIGIASFIIIHTTFQIALSKRKKEFGTLRSIGFNKKQIIEMVLLEVIILTIIAIIFSFFVSQVLANTLIATINKLASRLLIGDLGFLAFDTNVTLTLYYNITYVLIAIGYIIVTILISTFLPIWKASKTSPIEAIKQDSYWQKIKNTKHLGKRKIKNIERNIASQYRKQNKANTITIIASLALIIILLVVTSNYLSNIYAYMATENRNYNYLMFPNNEQEYAKWINEIKNTDLVDSYFTIKSMAQNLSLRVPEEKIHPELIQIMKEENKKINLFYNENTNQYKFPCKIITLVEEKEYQNLLQKLGIKELKEGEAVLLNKIEIPRYISFHLTQYQNGETLKIYQNSIENPQQTTFTTPEFNELFPSKPQNINTQKPQDLSLKLVKATDSLDKYLTYPDIYELDSSPIAILVSPSGFETIKTELEQQLKQYYQDESQTMVTRLDMYLQSSKPYELENKMKSEFSNKIAVNYQHRIDSNENKKLITELLIYSIIGLLAIASYFCIFNILFSNIQSRKKDFANLKSIGMSQKQIHKILWIESTWYCAVSSIIGILAGIGVFLLIYYIENKVRGGYGLYQYEIVWQNILICIAFAIFSVYSSMLIARKSIKKNNIIESIKEENI